MNIKKVISAIVVFSLLLLAVEIIPAYMRYNDIIDTIKNDASILGIAKSQFLSTIFNVIFLICVFLVPIIICFNLGNKEANKRLALIFKIQVLSGLVIFLFLKNYLIQGFSIALMVVGVLLLLFEVFVLWKRNKAVRKVEGHSSQEV
jgi:hypothetical protein